MSSLAALPPALADAWAQAEGESDAEYEQFLLWLDQGDARSVPAQENRVSAAKWNWSERALAYERARALTEHAQGTPEEQIEKNLLHLALLEAGKLLRSSATSITPIVSVGELVKLLAHLAELKVSGNTSQQTVAPPDVSKLSTDDLRKILDAQAIVQRARGE